MDERGRPHLASRILPRDPITLGPAQVSRMVFSTPRVSQLLGLTNLELRDLNRSSLDTVSLGRPHLLYLPRGIVQIQSLYKGASGPGVSRLIGVTAYVNGRAAVGTDVDDAVRQALHEPPRVDVVKPARAPGGRYAGRSCSFRVQNARREVITITSPAGRQDVTRAGPDRRGNRRLGADRARPGSRARRGRRAWTAAVRAASTTFSVLSRAPAVRVTRVHDRVRVGRPVRFSFKVADALSEVTEVSTRDGTFTRRYRLRNGTGFFEWTPTAPGPAELRVSVRGREGQTAVDSLKLTVAPGPPPAAATVTMLQVPDRALAGRASDIAFSADGAREVVARIAGDDGEAREWRFSRPAGRMALAWTPARAGDYRLTVSAQASGGTTTQTTIPLTAGEAP